MVNILVCLTVEGAKFINTFTVFLPLLLFVLPLFAITAF